MFHIAWCCQPHRMGHGQHLDLKWIRMDGGKPIVELNVMLSETHLDPDAFILGFF